MVLMLLLPSSRSSSYSLFPGAKDDINQHALSPTRNERPILLLQRHDGSTWNEVLCQEPWRDSNKLYASMRGVQRGEAHCMDLEDFGIAEKEIVNPSVLENLQTEELSSLGNFLGGAWVGAPESTEGYSWQITDTTRVGAAVHDTGRWHFVFFALGDVFPGKLWNKNKLLEIVNRAFDLTTADIILPLLEPQKVIMPKGVVFFG